MPSFSLPADLVISAVTAENDADLEALVEVRRRATPDAVATVDNLGFQLESETQLVVGYAALQVFGDEAHHGLTATRRDWRRRGVATALKRAEIAAAKRAGFRRLVT